MVGLWFFVAGGGVWQVDRANFGRMFEALPWLLAGLVIPLVTMRALAEEKRSGTLELLITMPVKDSEVILGKYFAALGMCVDPPRLLAPLPGRDVRLAVAPRRRSTGGRCGRATSGCILFCAAGSAIGLLLSSHHREPDHRVLHDRVSLAILVFLGLLAQWTHGLSATSPASSASSRASKASPAVSSTRARSSTSFDLRRLPARSLPLSREPEVVLGAKPWKRRPKPRLESGALILIIAAILVAVNALGVLGLHKRMTRRKNEKFTLSKGSGNLFRSLKENMQVDAYVTKGLPKLDAFVRDLRDLLQEYKNAGGGKFDYTISSPKTRRREEVAKDAGLVEQPFGEASDTEEKAAVTQGFMGLVFKYGTEKDAIKFMPPDRTAASSSGSRRRSAKSGTRGTTSSTRLASSPATTRSSSTGREPRPEPGPEGRSSIQTDHHAELPLLRVPGRRPEGG